MKKFKSMKKRDEKMESLLIEKWGYSTTILNEEPEEDGDKGLLQELAPAVPAVVAAAPTILGLTKAAWAAIAATAAIAGTYANSVYRESENREAIDSFNKEIGAMQTAGDYTGDYKPEDREGLGRGDIGVTAPISDEERERLEKGEEPIIVTAEPEKNYIELDPDVTDIDPDLQKGAPSEEPSGISFLKPLEEKQLTAKEIVKEEINKYFSNRRKN